jgi:hypothetical protein
MPFGDNLGTSNLHLCVAAVAVALVVVLAPIFVVALVVREVENLPPHPQLRSKIESPPGARTL